MRSTVVGLAVLAGALFATPAALAAPPQNDNFSQATQISAFSPFFSGGSNVDATKETGEPNHAGNAGGHSVWFKAQSPVTGHVVIALCDSSFDTLAAVYTGSSVGSLTLVAQNDNSADCGSGSTQSVVSFSATKDTDYFLAVDGKDGATGNINLQLSTNDDFANAQFVPDPRGSVGGPGGFPAGGGFSPFGMTRGATKEPFEPNHAGNSGGKSTWFTFTASQSGQVQAETCSAPTPAGGFSGLQASTLDTVVEVYTGSSLSTLVSQGANDNSAGCGQAGLGSRVTWNTVAGETYRIAVDGKDAAAGTFVLTLHSRPPNDDFSAAAELAPEGRGYSFQNVDNTLATKETGEPNHAGNPTTHSAWYVYTAPRSGPVKIDTCSTAFFSGGRQVDTVLGVYTGSAVGSLSEVTSNDDAPTGTCPPGPPGSTSAGASQVTFNATSGTTYYVAVDGKGGDSGQITLSTRTRPGNDDFADAQTLDLSSGEASDSRNTELATAQTGEPNHAGATPRHSIWYRIAPSQSGPVHLDTCGSGADTVLGVYTGNALGSLNEVASNDDAAAVGPTCSPATSRVSFNAAAGTTYFVAVDDKGTGGFIFFHALGRPANDDFANAFDVNANPSPFGGYSVNPSLATSQTGEPAHAGSPANRSVWYEFTASATGQATIDTCSSSGGGGPSGSSPPDTTLAVYTGSTFAGLTPVASNDDAQNCGVSSQLSRVTLNVTDGTTYRLALDVKGTGDVAGVFLHIGLPQGPPPPAQQVSIDDVSLAEGDAGQKNMTFTVSRTGDPNAPATSVNFATANDTATAGSDYVATSGTATIPQGQTSTQVNVPIIGDTVDEQDEDFTVNLSNPVNGTIADGSGMGTITDDDGPPPSAFSVNDVTVTEGNSGTVDATFTISRTNATNPASIKYHTEDGTGQNAATEGDDYTALPLTEIGFAAGEASKQVTVKVKGDTVAEPNEIFRLLLSDPSAGATIADGEGQGQINNDDAAPPSLTIDSPNVFEGNSGTRALKFTITRTGSADAPATTFHYATQAGTATEGVDYQGASGTGTIPQGQSSTTVTVQVIGDTTNEPDETLRLVLSNYQNGTPGADNPPATIRDDDDPAGDPAPVQKDFASGQGGTVDSPGGATSPPGQFFAPNGAFNFPATVNFDQDPPVADDDSPPPPPNPNIKTLADYFDVEVLNKDTSTLVDSGFEPPLELRIPIPPFAANFPDSELIACWYAVGGGAPGWTPIPYIGGRTPPALQAGEKDGFFITGTGAGRVIHILSRHLTTFSAFQQVPQAPTGNGTSGGGTSGGGGSTSPTKKTSPGATALAKPTLALRGGTFKVDAKGFLSYALANPNSYTLTGRVRFETAAPVVASAKKKKAKKLTVGKKSFSIAAGKTQVLRVKLSAKARKLLRRRKSLKLRAIVDAANPQGAKSSANKVFTVRVAKAKAKKKRR